MILNNAKPRLLEAHKKANESGKEVEATPFIYNELLDYDSIYSVFEWLFKAGIDFRTEHREYRFVIHISPDPKHRRNWKL